MIVVHKDEATADSSNMIWVTIMGGECVKIVSTVKSKGLKSTTLDSQREDM